MLDHDPGYHCEIISLHGFHFEAKAQRHGGNDTYICYLQVSVNHILINHLSSVYEIKVSLTNPWFTGFYHGYHFMAKRKCKYFNLWK